MTALHHKAERSRHLLGRFPKHWRGERETYRWPDHRSGDDAPIDAVDLAPTRKYHPSVSAAELLNLVHLVGIELRIISEVEHIRHEIPPAGPRASRRRQVSTNSSTSPYIEGYRPASGPIPTEAEFAAAISKFLLIVAIVAGVIAAGTLLIFLI